MLNVKYFAYGSNIKYDRLKDRVEFFGELPLQRGIPYTLNGYALNFGAGAMFGGWSYANIVPMINYQVEGILYDLTPEQFERLDRYEALYEKQYFQIDKDTIGCTYIAKRYNVTKRLTKPTLEYLNIILDGCRETNLTKTYNMLLAYKLANYKLKKSKHRC